MSRPATAVRELVIERLGAQGDGVAEGPVYIAGVLPGERVRVGIDGERPELVEVVSPSPERADPPCPHFGDCGGCSLQHWAPAPYLIWKAAQIRHELARVGIETELLA